MPEAGGLIGVILAGGQSRRMGAEKSLIELAGRPLAAHVAERLGPQVDRLILNANGDPARFSGLALEVVPDTLPGYRGPLAGVLAGLIWARGQAPGSKGLVTVPADTPFLPADLAARFAAVHAPGRIVIAASRGRLHPAVGLWPPGVEEALARELTDEPCSVIDWVIRRDHAAVVFADEGGRDPFFNINTPEDLKTALAAL